MIVIDARQLEPPEPFERVVAALMKLGRNEVVLVILEREPRPLYRFLAENDYRYESVWVDQPDPRWEVRIWEQA